MAWFDLFRDEPYPTLYGPRKTAVTADVLESGLLYAICILAFSLAIIIPGVRGRERLYYSIRMTVSIFVLGSILLVNFGQEWDVAQVRNLTIQYRAGLVEEIQADIALKISLRNINITLKGVPEERTFNDGIVKERINYNERFSWDNEGWTQGRMGFGPYAGLFNQEYRAAQEKGLPYPILWIAEYFTLDGEWIRWGRFYRQAGYYTHIMVWLAFPLWILTIITFKMVLDYGAMFSLLTGCSLITANLIYACVRNPNELVIPLTADGVLKPHFGWCFWLCLFNGILTIVIGIVVFVLNKVIGSESVAAFFSKDVISDFEEIYADPAVFAKINRSPEYAFNRLIRTKSRDKYEENDIESNENGETVGATEDSCVAVNPEAEATGRHYRKRTIVRSIDREYVKKPKAAPRRRVPPPVADNENKDEGDDYENMEVTIQYDGRQKGHENVAFQS